MFGHVWQFTLGFKAITMLPEDIMIDCIEKKHQREVACLEWRVLFCHFQNM
jgi:hypothetical protein